MIIPQSESYKTDSRDKDCNRYTKFFSYFLSYEICHFPNSFIINLLAKISKIKKPTFQ